MLAWISFGRILNAYQIEKQNELIKRNKSPRQQQKTQRKKNEIK